MPTLKDSAKRYKMIMEDAAAYIAVEKPLLDSPEKIADFMRPIVQQLTQEVFFVIHLNAKNRLLSFKEATIGLVDKTQIHAREVFRNAILSNCSRIILVHNHPSGEPTPSSQDISCTRQLVEAGKIIGIDVLDHVIVGEKTATNASHISFRQQNLM